MTAATRPDMGAYDSPVILRSSPALGAAGGVGDRRHY
jgi:hypothetical protein